MGNKEVFRGVTVVPENSVQVLKLNNIRFLIFDASSDAFEG